MLARHGGGRSQRGRRSRRKPCAPPARPVLPFSSALRSRAETTPSRPGPLALVGWAFWPFACSCGIADDHCRLNQDVSADGASERPGRCLKRRPTDWLLLAKRIPLAEAAPTKDCE